MTDRYFGFLEDVLGAGDARLYSLEERRPIAFSRIDASAELVLFVPGTEIAVLNTVLPGTSEAEAKLAAPFAIEDEVAEPVESLHIALGKKPAGQGGLRTLHVGSASVVEQWRGALDLVHSGSIMLVVEQSVLPKDYAIDIGPRILLSIDGKQSSFDQDMPREVLKSLAGGKGLALTKPDWALPVLADMFAGLDDPIDLLQGRFRSRRSVMNFDWRSNLGSAAFAAVFIFALLGSMLVEIWVNQRTIATLEGEIQAMVKPIFPDQQTVRNPARAVSRAVAELGDGPSLTFLDASAAIYTALEDLPGAQLQGLRYEPSRSGFIARIAYSAFGDDATLKTLLSDFGIVATVGDSRQINGFVLGDVTMEVDP